MKVKKTRNSPGAAPMLMIYPLVRNRPWYTGKRPGVLITVWRTRIEIRW